MTGNGCQPCFKVGCPVVKAMFRYGAQFNQSKLHFLVELRLFIVKQKNSLHFKYEDVNNKHT
jgi:hypothetical protein